VGPFKEEEEGTGVTSDIVKVSGHPRSHSLRNDPGTERFPNIGLIIKQSNTHWARKSG